MRASHILCICLAFEESTYPQLWNNAYNNYNPHNSSYRHKCTRCKEWCNDDKILKIERWIKPENDDMIKHREKCFSPKHGRCWIIKLLYTQKTLSVCSVLLLLQNLWYLHLRRVILSIYILKEDYKATTRLIMYRETV